MIKTVIIFAGGTGGHIYPGLALAEELTKKGFQCHWVGTASGMESSIVVEHGFPFLSISISGLRRSGFLRLLAAPFAIVCSIVASISIIRRLKQPSYRNGGLCEWPRRSCCLFMPMSFSCQ